MARRTRGSVGSRARRMTPDATAVRPMRTLLICHEGAPLHEEGLARWLASFSTLAGIVVLREPPRTLWRRVRREIRRVGVLRFLDVLAFRLYYRVAHARR